VNKRYYFGLIEGGAITINDLISQQQSSSSSSSSSSSKRLDRLIIEYNETVENGFSNIRDIQIIRKISIV
jgi:hypothetical protein